MHEAGGTLALERDLDQVDARGCAGGQGPRRAPAAREGHAPEAVPRAEAPPRAAGLDLDHDQGRALGEEQVELAEARSQAARQEAPALPPQAALDQALARQGIERVVGLQDG